jgi:hypothetical protein
MGARPRTEPPTAYHSSSLAFNSAGDDRLDAFAERLVWRRAFHFPPFPFRLTPGPRARDLRAFARAFADADVSKARWKAGDGGGNAGDNTMSKPTVSAAGGAMPAEDHKTPSLLNIADALDMTKYLIVAAANLAAEMNDIEGNALNAVICAAGEKLLGARAMLAAIRGEKAAVATTVERHKAAWEAPGGTLAAVDEVVAEQQGRATVPTTLVGLRAAIEYAVEIDRGVPHVGGFALRRPC